MRRALIGVGAVLGCMLLVLGGATEPRARAVDTPLLRVGIALDRPLLHLAADGPVVATDLGTMRDVTLPGGEWSVLPGPEGIEIGDVALGPVVRLTSERGFLRVEGRAYRGRLEVDRTPAGRLVAINEVDIESYLYGVIKGEIDPRWPPDAVKAQAIASRTLALQRLQAAHASAQPSLYDLPATTSAQVYLGVAGEDPRGTAAVDATRGLVITYEGRPIFAAYHSNSGGHTEDSETVWGTAYPYLRGVPDPYALTAPRVEWTASVPLFALQAALERGGVDLPGLSAVAPGRTTPWGRAITMRLVDQEGGTREMNANRFRLLAGPSEIRSTLFTAVRVRGGSVEFAGKGSGHGVGLDQWGAREMALQGYTAEQILKYYYTGVAVGPGF